MEQASRVILLYFVKLYIQCMCFVLFTQKSSIGLHIPSHSHTLCLATYVATNRNSHFPIAIDRSYKSEVSTCIHCARGLLNRLRSNRIVQQVVDYFVCKKKNSYHTTSSVIFHGLRLVITIIINNFLAKTGPAMDWMLRPCVFPHPHGIRWLRE